LNNHRYDQAKTINHGGNPEEGRRRTAQMAMHVLPHSMRVADIAAAVQTVEMAFDRALSA
jgi:hypothetical protein